MPAEQVHHLSGFVLSQQPIVDEDTSEAPTDGSVKKDGDDGGIHPAAQSADDLPGPNPFSHIIDRLV
jgi:hypothetical protein